jgi:hypothetical protein
MSEVKSSAPIRTILWERSERLGTRLEVNSVPRNTTGCESERGGGRDDLQAKADGEDQTFDEPQQSGLKFQDFPRRERPGGQEEQKEGERRTEKGKKERVDRCVSHKSSYRFLHRSK